MATNLKRERIDCRHRKNKVIGSHMGESPKIPMETIIMMKPLSKFMGAIRSKIPF